VKTRLIEMTESDVARFWSKVDKRGPDDCWEWNAHKYPNGYGLFRMRKIAALHLQGTTLRACTSATTATIQRA